MSFRRPRHRPDLHRVAWILAADRGGDAAPRRERGATPGGAREVADEARSGWVPARPGLVATGRELVAERLKVRAAPVVDDELARLDVDLRRARRPGLVTVPDHLASARRASSGTAVLALLALVLAAGCVFGLRVLWAERSAGDAVPSVALSGPRATSLTVTGPTDAPGGVTGASPGSTHSASAAATLVIHVVGRVKRPGLVRLPAGSRVADAIDAAGGARDGADLSALNLAQPLVDGQQVHVPAPGEVVAPPQGAAGARAGSAAGPGPVDVNTADLAALDTLPGVGPVLAQRILDWRAEHGRFTSVDELGEVSGIGDKLLAQLRPRVVL